MRASPAIESNDRALGSIVGLVVFATGPKPWLHPIVAIGAASPAGPGAVAIETLVRPAVPCRVPAYLAVYGVTVEQLESAPPLESALEELLAAIGDATIVGLDTGVALARLQFALRSLGRPPLANPFVELARPGHARPDLARLARQAGLIVPARPGPGTLARLAAELGLAQAAGRPRASLAPSDARSASPNPPTGVVSALQATEWRELLDASRLPLFPLGPGVYLFRGADDEVLYVGKAASLRGRLADYLTASFAVRRAMPGLIDATRRIEVHETACELAARMGEAELIATLAPPYNVQRASEPRLAFASLRLADAPAGGGIPRLRLVLGDSLGGVPGGRPDGDPLPRARALGEGVFAATGQADSQSPSHGVPPTPPAGGDDRAPEPRAQCLDDRSSVVLTTESAARTAFAALRRRWWPPRPRVAERPSASEIAARFAALAAELREAVVAAEVAPGLRSGDLARLLVVAPVRPARQRAAELDEPDGDWHREARDLDWPPRARNDDFPLEDGRRRDDSRPRMAPDAANAADRDDRIVMDIVRGRIARVARLSVDVGGDRLTDLRGALQNSPPFHPDGAPTTSSAIDERGVNALARGHSANRDSQRPIEMVAPGQADPRRPGAEPRQPEWSIAAIAVLVAALRRHEPRVAAWPFDVGAAAGD